MCYFGFSCPFPSSPSRPSFLICLWLHEWVWFQLQISFFLMQLSFSSFFYFLFPHWFSIAKSDWSRTSSSQCLDTNVHFIFIYLQHQKDTHLLDLVAILWSFGYLIVFTHSLVLLFLILLCTIEISFVPYRAD